MTYLLDIEGTTTSISFVYDELFPYARAHCRSFLQAHWDDAEVQADLATIREDALRDAREGLAVETFGTAPTLDEVVGSVLSQMDLDRKNSGLKSLEGKLWADAYKSGEVRGHLFPDVAPALRRAAKDGNPVYIYSSGSVAAQKLLFRYSVEGDLTGLLSGYFDTGVGSKRERASYKKIAHELRTSPQDILFATDNLAEADAARDAGMGVVVVTRPGNSDLPPTDHRIAKTFDDFM